MGAKLTSLSYLGMAVETTLGTPVPPTGFIPIRGFRPQDNPKYIPDTGYRGQPVDLFGEYLGPVSADYQVEGDFFPGSGGNLLASMFGTDTLTGTATPYTHAFTVNEDPPSLTLSDYYVAGFRQWPGAKMDKLDLKFSADAGLSYTGHFIGFPSATGSAPSSETFGVNPFFLGWEAAITVDATADAKLESATISMQRPRSEALFAANNSNQPYDIFVGPMAATMALSFYMEDDTEYVYALTEGTHIVAITFTQPGTSDTLTITASALQFTRPTINRAGQFVIVQLDGSCVYNATDSGVIQASLVNSVSAAYTTTSAS